MKSLLVSYRLERSGDTEFYRVMANSREEALAVFYREVTLPFLVAGETLRVEGVFEERD